MSNHLNKLAAEFNRYFTSSNGVDVPERVSVSRDEWRQLHAALHACGQATQAEVTDEQINAAYLAWCKTNGTPESFARAILALRPAAQTEQQPVASAPVADERVAKLDAECNSLAHQLNASNERNGMLRVALSDCSAELFAQCGDQSRAMSYVNAARAILALHPVQVPMTDELCWQIWDKAGACDEVNERVTLKVAKPIIRAIVAAYLEVTAQAKKEQA